MMRAPDDQVEVRSALTADYSPWTTAFFPGLDPSILLAALRDRNEAGLLDTRRMMNCFLLTSNCETADPDENHREEADVPAATPVRIDNNVEPDLTQPDGQGLLIEPGREIILDLRSAPILVTGSDELEADLLIYIIQDSDHGDNRDSLEVSLALRLEDVWIPVFSGGDQTHGDMEQELPYSDDSEVLGENENPITSSDDVFAQEWTGYAVDVDAWISEPGLYGWMRIGINPEASEAVTLDAVVVVDAIK